MTIEVTSLSKTFWDLERGRVVALDNVTFTCGPGQIFGLLGPNGAGKTTAMRILCTLLKPTGGSARVAGFDVVSQPQLVRQHIGFLSATTGVYDRMTPWEFVAHFARLHGLEGAALQRRMDELFQRLQLHECRDVLGAHLSTGMKQKASIARALVHDPPVLIFDEPTAGLDVLVARNVLETILALKQQGKCILFSTHIMREVELICDRVVILSRGRMLVSGTLEELRRRFGSDNLEEVFIHLLRADEPAG
ncbi:MAG: ABC transporter ATP-binding protein [Gemmataceae bacterium]